MVDDGEIKSNKFVVLKVLKKMIRKNHLVKINLAGGIVPAGYLASIIAAAETAHVSEIHFGTRQQMFLKVTEPYINSFQTSLQKAEIAFEVNRDEYPNIVSSYVTENVFSNSKWLSEGVYRDILDGFDYTPGLKINIVDCDQTLVPFFTGNFNFISSATGNYFFLYIRFPKTRGIYRWPQLVYFQDIPRISKVLEKLIVSSPKSEHGQIRDGNVLYAAVQGSGHFIFSEIVEELTLPAFSLPYYEGFNRYENKNWLGIYRRDEVFDLKFLKDISRICLQTKIAQLYVTPWKSLIIKGIDLSDRKLWDHVLGKYRINVRHASNELNWQIEDNCEEGLNLKRYLIRQFDKEDVRTYGLCFAIKTKPNTGLFGSIIIRKLTNPFPNQRKNLDRYEISYLKDFNPNAKEFIIFRTDVEKENLGVYLVSLCKYYYAMQSKEELLSHEVYQQEMVEDDTAPGLSGKVFQCLHCLTVYDPGYGDESANIPPGTAFEELDTTYECSTCNAPKKDFAGIEKMSLIVQ